MWADISNLASHVEWMGDANSIEFLSVQTGGPGTRMRVATRVGPFRTSDVIEVTGWDSPRVMAVSHGTAAVGQGPHAAEEAGDGGPRPGREHRLFAGSGRFVLEPIDAGTRFRWEEDIRFPWYLGGPVGAWLARPVLGAIWRRNLRRLATRFV